MRTFEAAERSCAIPCRRIFLALLFAALLPIAGCGSGSSGGSGGGGGGGGGNGTTLVSGPSPFAPGCATSPDKTEKLYVNAEVEPYLAVNPLNPSNLIGVWQQDRWDGNGSAAGILTGSSRDGGKTWTRTFAHFSNCSGGTAANGGNYERASDPWVTIGPDGIAYQITVSGDRSTARRAVLVSRSTDGGGTWSEPIALTADNFGSVDAPQVVDDKTSITADPIRAGFAYAVWDRIYSNVTLQDDGPFTFSRTTDGGMTWEAWRNVYDPGPNRESGCLVIAVQPNGTLVAASCLFLNNNSFVAVFRSTDQGITWSQPIIVNTFGSIGVIDVKNNAKIRTGSGPQIAIDRTTGTLYVAWEDARFSNGQRDGIAFSKSTDGGLSWSSPVEINQAPNVQAFTAQIDVASDGTIGVDYYDFRKDTPDPSVLLTNYWQITSSDGGNSWVEVPVGNSFDMLSAPDSGGFFVGDYEALVHAGTQFFPFFVLANSGNTSNPTDVFVLTGIAKGDTSTNGHIEINTHPRTTHERIGPEEPGPPGFGARLSLRAPSH